MVMVAGDHDDLGPGLTQCDQGLVHQLLGRGTRAGRVVDITGHQHRVHLFGTGQVDDLAQHLPMLVEAAAAS